MIKMFRLRGIVEGARRSPAILVAIILALLSLVALWIP